MSTTNNLIWNPEEIRIPPRTLVALCGVANSGKTTFAKEAFPKELIISTDEILEYFSSEIVKITEKDLKLTPEDPFWDKISLNLARIVILKLQEASTNLIIDSSFRNKVTVLESVNYSFVERVGTLLSFSHYFNDVYLIVIHPNEKELKSRNPKPLTKNYKAMNFHYPSFEEILTQHSELQNQISNGDITAGSTKTFIISDTSKTPKIILP